MYTIVLVFLACIILAALVLFLVVWQSVGWLTRHIID